MASEPNLRALPEALPPHAKKKAHGTGASLSPVNGNEQAWTDFRARSPLARSAGPLACPALPGGPWVVVAYVIADLSCAAFTFAVLLMARYAPSWRSYSISGAFNVFSSNVPKEYVGVLLLYAALVVLFSQMYRLYGTPRDRSRSEEAILVAKALAWSTAVLATVIYASGTKSISRLVIIASASLNVIVLASWRAWKRSIVERRVTAGIGVRNALIVGAGKIGREIATYFENNKHLGVVIKGFLDHNHVGDPNVLGKLEELAEVARAHFIDEIIITIPFMHRRVTQALIVARTHNIDVKIVPDLYGSFGCGATLEYIGHVPVMSLRTQPIPALGLILKRAIDIAGSLAALVLLSPLLAAIGIAIKVDSRGPVLYRSLRVGKRGKTFTFYKFRTMIENADELKRAVEYLNQRDAIIFKVPNDPRITRLGRFLRKYSLDELPQLWNVLKRDMSLVGPRPPVPEECERYKLEHLRRLDVTPGITGLWQVAGRRDASFEKYVEFDLQYIEGWSLWTDIKILLRTVPSVLQGEGQ